MKFWEILHGLKEGKKFERESWPVSGNIELKGSVIIDSDGYNAFLYFDDFEATDWVEVKE